MFTDIQRSVKLIKIDTSKMKGCIMTKKVNTNTGDKTLGGVRLREKKYRFHLGHHNKNSFVGKPKDLAVHV